MGMVVNELTQLDYYLNQLKQQLEFAKHQKPHFESMRNTASSIHQLANTLGNVMLQQLCTNLRERLVQQASLQEIEQSLQPIGVWLQAYKSKSLADVKITHKQTIAIALRDHKLAQKVAQQIAPFNFHTQLCDSFESLLNLLEKPNSLGLILLDAEYALASSRTLSAKVGKLPIIYISKKDDIATRLTCAISGGQAFLSTPIEISQLSEKIEQFIFNKIELPIYKIFVIDENQTFCNQLAQQLPAPLFLFHCCDKISKLDSDFNDFLPDLFLINCQINQLFGLQVANMLRQHPDYLCIPIIFAIQSDNFPNKSQYSKNGDDLLLDHMNTFEITNRLIQRAQRHRQLHAQMTKDSLTGLLTHSHLLQQLEHEIARAKRSETPLTFVMFDIDHFKQVNDKYGHLTGDKVIKSLALMLKQQLRKSDSIGRYGGEEFAMILPQTHAKELEKKLKSICERVEQLVHLSPHRETFYITISCGVAEMNGQLNTVEKIISAADKALYKAKAQGRNCVKIYENKLPNH